MRYNVAVFPAGTEIALEINNALRFAKNINVIGFSSIADHTRFIYDKYIENIPFWNDEKFIDILNEEISKNKVEYIYPAHDDVLLFLTQNSQKINAKIITSEINTVDICRSKRKTYEFLKEENFVPKVYNSIFEVEEYPVFIKPDIGQGSQGAKLINNFEELKLECSKKDMVIVENLPGNEYTIDCFTDINGNLKFMGPRIRNRIKSGISVNSKNIKLTKDFENIANIINSKLKFNGAWFFQIKEDINGELKLLEIAARVPGTMGLSRNKGINFPLLTIYNHLGIDTKIINNNYDIELDRAFINRYKLDISFDTVYIDFDDTIIINNSVNKYTMFLLYQFVNENKKIILLTKHKQNIYDTLKKFKISKDLFNEIISINSDDEKIKYIKELNSIFIDDSFSEREKVYNQFKIPVFDLDEIESLIDWKVYNYKEDL